MWQEEKKRVREGDIERENILLGTKSSHFPIAQLSKKQKYSHTHTQYHDYSISFPDIHVLKDCAFAHLQRLARKAKYKPE